MDPKLRRRVAIGATGLAVAAAAPSGGRSPPRVSSQPLPGGRGT